MDGYIAINESENECQNVVIGLKSSVCVAKPDCTKKTVTENIFKNPDKWRIVVPICQGNVFRYFLS